RLRAAVQGTAAIGTRIGSMFYVVVDSFGRWLRTACTHVPELAARLLLSLARGTGFEVRRFHARGSSVRVAVGGRVPLRRQLGDVEQRERDRLFALSEDSACLLLGKRRPQWQIAWNHIRGIRSRFVGPLS